jgi:aldose 1-epimerase
MPFGDGAKVWTLRASDGSIEVRVTDYGAAIVGCVVRDRDGNKVEVIRSPQSREGLVADSKYWRGATIGRYANRIGASKFYCNSSVGYSLDANEGVNHLHGGADGFGRRMWTYNENAEHSSGSTAAFTLVSPSGDMGYPGKLAVRIQYSVKPGGHLVMHYNAQLFDSNEALECPVNLTNHAYWWLGGSNETIDNHELWYVRAKSPPCVKC